MNAITSPVQLDASQSFVNDYLANLESQLSSNQNVVSSPVGFLLLLTTILGTAAPKGKTAQQISTALKLGPGSPRMQQMESRSIFDNVYTPLTQEKSETKKGTIYNVPIAGAVFLQKSYKINPWFPYLAMRYFQAPIKEVNFVDGQDTVEQINSWVNEKSNGLIPKMFDSPGEIDPMTRMMLFNVFAFKDNWRATLDDIGEDSFRVNSHTNKSMKMMFVSESMPYVERSGYRAIKKPMLNERFSFVIILPNKPFDLEAIDRMLFHTSSVKQLFKDHGSDYNIELRMPQFQLSGKQDLIPIAQRMGMIDMFKRGVANFEGITQKELLHIDKMEQAAVLRVDKYGVEAAAATFASFTGRSLGLPFRVDQPFGCMIYDEQSDLPLLVAKVVEPMQ